MKKKLFVWAYTHNPSRIETCALTEGGEMLFVIHNLDHKKTVEKLFKGNTGLQEEYDITVVDQDLLEKHIYQAGPRELLNEDFRSAWDKYKENLQNAANTLKQAML